MEKQNLALWCVPCITQRQAQYLISGPDLATGARLLSCNRTQPRVVFGLLTRHNTLRRHLRLVGNEVLKRKLQSTFRVSVRPWPPLGIYIWFLSSWTQRILR